MSFIILLMAIFQGVVSSKIDRSLSFIELLKIAIIVSFDSGIRQIAGAMLSQLYLVRAHCLLQPTDMTRDDIRILDPHEELLHEWHERAKNCGMKYLRSSSVHPLDIHPFSLRRFAALDASRKATNFIAPKTGLP